jgi:hypothetical protein
MEATGEGRDRRGDYQGTLADASSHAHPGPGGCAEMTGTGRCEAAGGSHGDINGQRDTAVPGVEDAHKPGEAASPGAYRRTRLSREHPGARQTGRRRFSRQESMATPRSRRLTVG